MTRKLFAAVLAATSIAHSAYAAQYTCQFEVDSNPVGSACDIDTAKGEAQCRQPLAPASKLDGFCEVFGGDVFGGDTDTGICAFLTAGVEMPNKPQASGDFGLIKSLGVDEEFIAAGGATANYPIPFFGAAYKEASVRLVGYCKAK